MPDHKLLISPDRILTPSRNKSTFVPIEPTGALKKLIDQISTLLDRTGIEGLQGSELATLKKLVFEAQIPQEEWFPFTFFREDYYARNLVDGGNGNYDLLLVAWLPKQKSFIHDHYGSHCMMKIMSGQIEETLYAGQLASPDFKRQAILETGEYAYIHDKIGLHRIANPSDEIPSVSLHLYSPPISKCSVLDERKERAVLEECRIDSYRGVPTS